MSKEYSHLLDSLLNGNALTEHEAYRLMNKLAEGELPEALAGALLAGLRAKGDSSPAKNSPSLIGSPRNTRAAAC